jgi:hypothetical protein
MAWIDGFPVLAELHVKYGLVCTARFGNGRSSSISAISLPVPEMARVNGYPLHPSEQDMISAGGIKDQALTIIVSMILIELTLLRLGRAAFFHRLRYLTRKGSSYWSRCISELGGRDPRDAELGGRVQRRRILRI